MKSDTNMNSAPQTERPLKIREILGRLADLRNDELEASPVFNAVGDLTHSSYVNRRRNAEALEIAIAVLEDTATDAVYYRGEFLSVPAPTVRIEVDPHDNLSSILKEINKRTVNPDGVRRSFE